MKYLIGTNIWLELLLKQEKAEEVSTFLDKIATEEIAISGFALHYMKFECFLPFLL
ncbi:MAG TPA: hypothetical protein VHO70_15015 [Chitinispirillaceae bacterium]|nr:hypothetical protein [Chitinispirillaceae bacterium]